MRASCKISAQLDKNYGFLFSSIFPSDKSQFLTFLPKYAKSKNSTNFIWLGWNFAWSPNLALGSFDILQKFLSLKIFINRLVSDLFFKWFFDQWLVWWCPVKFFFLNDDMLPIHGHNFCHTAQGRHMSGILSRGGPKIRPWNQLY